MDADPVPHGEFDVMPVEHRHQPLFEVIVAAEGGAFAEDGLSVFAADREFRLEEVVLVLGPRLFLGVDEEQCDDEVGVPLADLALNVNVGELWIGSLRLDRPVLEWDRDAAAPWVPLPDLERVAFVILLVFPLLPLVLAPSGAGLDRLDLGIDAEAHAER